MPGKLSLSLALYSAFASAYPFAALEQLQTRQTSPPQGAGALPLVPPPFDAELQLVSNSGQYEFVAPGSGDVRGPCPGLNAMANHGYLPRNGVATILQFQTATEKVFGMSPDLGAFLAVYGAVVDGTLTSWSIRGTPHIGIGGSHGNYETDSSPLRADLNQYGSNDELVMSQFYSLYNMQQDASTANYNLEVLRDFRTQRFQESIDKNPNFYYGAFSGMAVSQAAFTFIYRFMANKSAENPEGILNKNVLKSFMSIQGDDENNLKWVPGNEKIPDNWYKRHPTDEYSIPYFETDILYFTAQEPRIALPGCNQGKVGTYNQISVETLSGAAYTAASVAQNPLCFAMQFSVAALPSLTGLSSSLLQPLISSLSSATDALGGCPSIPNANLSALSVCPGFSLYGGPTGPVTAGAIQS